MFLAGILSLGVAPNETKKRHCSFEQCKLFRLLVFALLIDSIIQRVAKNKHLLSGEPIADLAKKGAQEALTYAQKSGLQNS